MQADQQQVVSAESIQGQPLLYTGVQYPTYYYPQPIPTTPQQDAAFVIPMPQPTPQPTSGVKCISCNNINAAGLNFCGNCGYSLAPSTPLDEQQKMEDKTSGSTSGGFCSRFQSWSLKSIVGFAVLANVAVILVWLIIRGFPFFIYPLAGSFAVASVLYVLAYAPDRKLFTCHALLSANLNVVLLFTYLFAFTSFPWFFMALIPCVALLALHHLIEQYRQPDWTGTMGQLFFKIHMYTIYLPLNVLLFVIFLTTTPETPWFLYPLLTTSLPVSLHYIFTYYYESPHKWIIAHLATFGQVNFFFFMVWYLANDGEDFPWFIIIMGITGVLAGIHYALHFHRERVSPRIQEMEKAGLHTLNQMKEPVSGVINNAVYTFNNMNVRGAATPNDKTPTDSQV